MSPKALSASDAWYQSVDKTSETDDERIKDITVLPPPEHLIRFFPIRGTHVEQLITQTRKAIHNIMAGKDDRLLVVIGPCSIHDPAAALDYARRLKEVRAQYAGHAGDRDARVLRKAAHHRGLEGPDQRPLPGRELPHRRRPAHRAPVAHRDQPPGRAGGQRVPGRDLAPVHRRPDRLGCHRRAHHREPGAPRAGLGPVGPDRLQERHGRQHPYRHRRHPVGQPGPPLPVGAQERPGRHRQYQGQQGLPRHPARRQGAQLRCDQCGRRLQGTGSRQAACRR
jgi:hypothetical protein